MTGWPEARDDAIAAERSDNRNDQMAVAATPVGEGL